jgi:hypothetical protein
MKPRDKDAKYAESGVSLFSSTVCRQGPSRLILLLGLGFALVLVAISPVQTALAASLNGNVLNNADFETGSLPNWKKWGYPRSTVMTMNCCNHTPGGAWSAFIVPDGKYVELQQEFLVGDGQPILPNNRYHLEGWV